MKIKSVKCGQFAGLRDFEQSFTNGINLVYGKNESGKSTLVNLISRTFFQETKLNKKTDKEFINLYFPKTQDNQQLDSIDGEISFETDDGTLYTLKKEWIMGEKGNNELNTPEGKLRTTTKIDETLEPLLAYQEGVYSEMVFSSQRNADKSLKNLLEDTSQAKVEIAEVIAQAFDESDGIPIERMEQEIQNTIDSLAKNWNTESHRPKDKKGRWAEKNCGEVLKAYYDWQDAKKEYEDIENLAVQYDKAKKDYEKGKEELKKIEDKQEDFNKYYSQLINKSNFESTQKAHTTLKGTLEKDLENWQKINENRPVAEKLKKELDNRSLLDTYSDAKKINDKLLEFKKDGIDKLRCPSQEEIDKVKKAQNKITKLNNKLCSKMNLQATVKKLCDYPLEVVSLLTGKRLDLSQPIEEAVIIRIPDIMELQLAPADVDVQKVTADIEKENQKINAVFQEYDVSSVEDLEKLAITVLNRQQQIQNAKKELDGITDNFEELENQTHAVAAEEVRSQKEIDKEIKHCCGSRTIEVYIESTKFEIEEYEQKYTHIDKLKQKISDLTEELNKIQHSLQNIVAIPEEYQNITDPEAYLEKLKKDFKEKNSVLEEILKTKITAENDFEGKDEAQAKENCEKAEKVFKEQEKLLEHWQHIQEVFEKCRTDSATSPQKEEIARKFLNYLNLISQDRLSSKMPEKENLNNISIYSNNRELNFDTLSEGTKETISFAFRLAVFDYLFPNGGVIVLDDPFANMDNIRIQQSVAILKEFVKKGHQVILLTCKEEYKTVFDNVIEI